ERHDLFHEAVFLSVLHASYLRRGELRSAVRYGAKCSDIADQLATPEVAHLAHSVIGGLSHYSGDLRRSRTELENHLTSRGTDKHVGPVYLAYDMHVRSAIHLARTLWLQGHPSEGIALTRRTISDAKRLEAPESLVAVSLLGASVFTWAGEYEAAGDAITFSLALAECHSMGRLVTVGRARKGELDVTRGFARDGVLALRAALAESHTGGEGLFATEFNVTLIHGLTTLGCFEEALPVADENIRLAKAEAALTYLPELLRLKGKLALASRHGIGEAKKLFQESLERSRQMGALAWELRTSVDLAALIASEGDFGYARRLLEDVCARFADSFRTRDINAAVRLLDTFR
ncbi:MAG: transcriptional regulator, partial [Hyphomicrobiales bacterium]|nr:transcriptional regulator [Hyphomicrobiales bacterium]